MVGIVLVSHSAALAEGVAELAREMGGADVPIEPAGGVDSDGPALGTDAVKVAEAIGRADRGDGVLVLMDLGSAVLSAEMARDLLPPDGGSRVLLSEAPFVEGAVAAAVAARVGSALEDVAAEARGGAQAKEAHLGVSGDGAAAPAETPPAEDERTLTLVVTNALGLHARPAARLVQTLSSFDADVRLTNVGANRGPASARSLNAVATLGVRQGDEVLAAASGREAVEALAALEALAARDFDDAPQPSNTVLQGLPAAEPAAPQPSNTVLLGRLRGLPAAPGLALAEARHFRAAEPQVPVADADDPDAEWAGLERALARVRDEVVTARDAVAARDLYAAAIFDAHLLVLADEALLDPTRRAIHEQQQNAARAWSDAATAVADEYRALDDEYLRARAADVDGLRRRVLEHLLGVATAGPWLSSPGVLVAADLTPAETATLDPSLVRALATAYGGPTAHSAILARSLGLPAVVGLGEAILDVDEGALLLVDGDAGVVEVDPPADRIAAHEARMRERESAELLARAAAAEPAATRDGRTIEVAANVGSPEEAAAAVEHGADGVGLLRTEFLFLGRDNLPGEDEQAEAYAAIAAALDGRPLILRTLDAGADKPLPALPQPAEANPFLGVRGIRLGLADPSVLATQLRAALRVAADHPLRIMFPMVATVEELRAALAVLAAAREQLGARAGGAEVGIMIEVPAAALAADALAREVDFFSVGTNDLAQYTLAADRGNERVAALADALHPAVLRLIGSAADAAAAHGRWIGVCGELASDPLAAAPLIGLGVSELSVAPPAVPATKQAVRAVDSADAAALARELLALESAGAVRARLGEDAAE